MPIIFSGFISHWFLSKLPLMISCPWRKCFKNKVGKWKQMRKSYSINNLPTLNSWDQHLVYLKSPPKSSLFGFFQRPWRKCFKNQVRKIKRMPKSCSATPNYPKQLKSPSKSELFWVFPTPVAKMFQKPSRKNKTDAKIVFSDPELP